MDKPKKMDYTNGQIYKIVCNITGEVYIGSTTQPLSKRLSLHKIKKNLCSSKQIIDRGNYAIVLIEAFPCVNKSELFQRERYHYDLIPNINRHRPFITQEEMLATQKAYQKAYQKANSEAVSATQKKYREANSEAVLATQKKYREANSESITVYQEAYREANREANSEAILAYQKAYYYNSWKYISNVFLKILINE